MYYARRRRKANLILQSLTPWDSGLTVSVGDYVSSENGTSPWIATTAGTSGSSPPTGQGAFNDGGVSWLRVDIPSLLQFLYSAAPAPSVS